MRCSELSGNRLPTVPMTSGRKLIALLILMNTVMCAGGSRWRRWRAWRRDSGTGGGTGDSGDGGGGGADSVTDMLRDVTFTENTPTVQSARQHDASIQTSTIEQSGTKPPGSSTYSAFHHQIPSTAELSNVDSTTPSGLQDVVQRTSTHVEPSQLFDIGKKPGNPVVTESDSSGGSPGQMALSQEIDQTTSTLRAGSSEKIYPATSAPLAGSSEKIYPATSTPLAAQTLFTPSLPSAHVAALITASPGVVPTSSAYHVSNDLGSDMGTTLSANYVSSDDARPIVDTVSSTYCVNGDASSTMGTTQLQKCRSLESTSASSSINTSTTEAETFSQVSPVTVTEDTTKVTTPRAPDTTKPETQQDKDFPVRVVQEKCMCHCKKASRLEKVTVEAVQEVKKEIQEKLGVDKTNITSLMLKKTSAQDVRPSATTVGYAGLVFLCLPFVLILLSDITLIIQLLQPSLPPQPFTMGTDSVYD